MDDYEKLGAFYLGRRYDPDARAVLPEPLLYDARDLTTHAVCVGMTGSGKTGLCITLLEEAAIDGIPAIAIDPKGDLGNLLLTFPELRAEDFRPWIQPEEATRKGLTPDELARKTAALWRQGLADWGQAPDRIRRFRDAVDLALYTPGSSAGLPVSVLGSFRAPPAALLDDPDGLRDRVRSAASGLLTLVGEDADPIRSREHILLSTLLDRAWREGRDVDLGALIREIQAPPLDRVGVLDLESFFPAKDRFALAMTFNNLLASPGFAAWMEGEPLDVGRLLYTPEGRPRLSILSVAHLSDPERMFFVSLLLNEVVAWMRGQPGTTSLRAMLYMDEVFGFFPPTANPPSKPPMLTLLKQARAFGLGVVLATQNPVDLDYKGLANAGTWFLGRLQTERDKARVVEGLEGVSVGAGRGFDRSALEATLAGLDSRVFLMNNVHEDAPALMHTRWALSYLRGPLTRAQIHELTAARPDGGAARAAPSGAAAPSPGPTAFRAAGDDTAPEAGERPLLPPGVTERFLPVRRLPDPGERLVYRPALFGTARLHFVQTRLGVDRWESLAVMAPLAPGPDPDDPWSVAQPLETAEPELAEAPDVEAGFAALPEAAASASSYAGWSKLLAGYLYRTRSVPLWTCRDPRATSEPGESEGDFRRRLAQRLREERDLALGKLRARHAPRLARMQDRIRVAEERVAREESQYQQQKMHTAISVGATLLGALFGRKAMSVGTVGRASTAMKGAARTSRERGDIARAQEGVADLRRKLEELEEAFREEATGLRDAVDPGRIELEETPIRPRKADITIGAVALVWTPWIVGEGGSRSAG